MMDKKINPEDLFKSMKKGLGKFYQEAKSSALTNESLLDEEIESIKNLRIEGRRYVRPRIHAQGGMKMIISTTDRLTRRQIAIAKMKENKLTKDSLKLFLHEARILARLDHPNIVPLHDIGIDSGGEPYFTMKLLSGESLGAILKRLSRKDPDYTEKYSMTVLLDIFLKVCDATAFAHSRNVVHRDLKPENIQVSDYGEVLLCDWGLAKDINLPAESTEEINLSEILSEQTMHGTIKGTPGFMAPEQVQEKAGDITEKTDIYALGCILYSLLTLCPPIENDSLEVLIKDTLEGNVIPASQRSKQNMPKALEAVIEKAMSVKPELRYKTVENLADEVRGYLNGFATKAQNADFRTLLYLLIKRHRAISVLIAVSFAIIATLIIFFLVKLKEREHVAIKAFQEVKKQRIEKDKLSKMAAPEFLSKAERLFNSYQFKKALQSVTLSKELDDSQKGAIALLARLQIGHMDFFSAAASLSKLKADTSYHKLYNFCIKYDQERKADIVALVLQLSELGEDAIIPCLMETFNSNNSPPIQQSAVLEIYRKFHNSQKSPTLTFIENGTEIKFNHGSRWTVKHLDFFKGMKLQAVDISRSQINDIRGIIGMPLKRLNLSRTSIIDLEVLKGLALEELDISYTKITTLDALKAIPLVTINISNASIRDLNTLEEIHSLKRISLSQKQFDKLSNKEIYRKREIELKITD